jgi:hypothetical protein
MPSRCILHLLALLLLLRCARAACCNWLLLHRRLQLAAAAAAGLLYMAEVLRTGAAMQADTTRWAPLSVVTRIMQLQ